MEITPHGLLSNLFFFQYLEDLKRNIQLSLGVGDDDSKVEQIQTYTTTS